MGLVGEARFLGGIGATGACGQGPAGGLGAQGGEVPHGGDAEGGLEGAQGAVSRGGGHGSQVTQAHGIGADRLDILVGNLLTDRAAAEKIGGGYDLVLANIVADVIIALAPRVRGLLSPGGTFLCSGIIEGRADEAAAALNAAGLEIRTRREDNGWYAFTCQ